MSSENRGTMSLRDLGLISDQEKNVEITGLSVDSKKIENGFLFIADGLIKTRADTPPRWRLSNRSIIMS